MTRLKYRHARPPSRQPLKNGCLKVASSLVVALCLTLTWQAASAQTPPDSGHRYEPPKEFDLLTRDEADGYCTALLGYLAHSLASRGRDEAQSRMFFAAQTVLVLELKGRGQGEDFARVSMARFRDSTPTKEAARYCYQSGLDAYERASEEDRQKAVERAKLEVSRRWPQR